MSPAAADDGSRLTNLVAALSSALGDRVRLATEAAVDQTGSGPAALVALLEFLDGATVERLRDAVGLTHSGTVRLVDRLVADGLVERGAGADGRSLGLRLTAAGRTAARRAQAARADALTPAIACLSERSAPSSRTSSRRCWRASPARSSGPAPTATAPSTRDGCAACATRPPVAATRIDARPPARPGASPRPDVASAQTLRPTKFKSFVCASAPSAEGILSPNTPGRRIISSRGAIASRTRRRHRRRGSRPGQWRERGPTCGSACR